MISYRGHDFPQHDTYLETEAQYLLVESKGKSPPQRTSKSIKMNATQSLYRSATVEQAFLCKCDLDSFTEAIFEGLISPQLDSQRFCTQVTHF